MQEAHAGACLLQMVFSLLASKTGWLGMSQVMRQRNFHICMIPTPIPRALIPCSSFWNAGDDVKVEGNLLKIRKSPGFVLGDLALLFNSPRSASIVAVTNIKMWAMDRRTFLKVAHLPMEDLIGCDSMCHAHLSGQSSRTRLKPRCSSALTYARCTPNKSKLSGTP